VIIDSSALVAVVMSEPDAARYAEALSAPGPRRVSAATLLETSIVVDGRRSPILSARLDDLLREAETVIEPVTSSQARLARQAYRDFGRGSGNPADLNYGDCFAYALAKEFGEPLLYKGTDFSHTDIRSALEIR
jgi:ribonuclease VapC